MHSTFTANDLWNLLCEQADLLDQLLIFGGHQQQAIAANRMSELIAILGNKQPYLERLEQVRKQLHAWQPKSEHGFVWPDLAQREQCQQKRDRSAQSFAALIDLEHACELALAQSRDQIQQRLKNFDSSRTAAAAYQSQEQEPASTAARVDFSSIG